MKSGELRPRTKAMVVLTIVVGRVRNGIRTGSSTIVDGTCPVTTDGDVDDDYRTQLTT